MNNFVLYILTAAALISAVSLFRIAIAFSDIAQAHAEDDDAEG